MGLFPQEEKDSFDIITEQGTRIAELERQLEQQECPYEHSLHTCLKCGWEPHPAVVAMIAKLERENRTLRSNQTCDMCNWLERDECLRRSDEQVAEIERLKGLLDRRGKQTII